MGAFEALAVATAMPTVARALDGLSLYALAFGGSLAASVVGMVAAGAWADRRGPAAPLRQGIAWFALGLLIAGLAPSMGWLLLGRVVQGYAGGLMSVSLYVAVGRTYPEALRPRIFAAFAAAWVIPAVVGPAISGAIVEHLGWRWVFLSVPALALAAAALVLPALRGLATPPAAADPVARTRLYWAVGAATSALLLHLAGHWPGIARWAGLALAVAALILCARRLLPVGSLRAARGLPTVIALRGLASAAFFGTEVFVPLLLSREHGWSPTAAGLVLTLGAVGWSTGSWYRGRPRQRYAAPQVLRAGLLGIALGAAAIAATLLPAAPVALGVAGWLLAGLGMGLVYPTLSVLALELSPPESQGINVSALQLGDALFTASVLAVGGTLFAALLPVAPSAAYLAGFGVSLALAALGAWLAPRVRPVG
ncbi:MFS transporter [Lysobacter silvisoli]|uniref:MFS transporter n=2 Tax=Lysobacter silvisoli TaxID=2293254 RepID=A0A371K6X0_9GAMM|nr:MFS transporter [Lysobacter silvisoli]